MRVVRGSGWAKPNVGVCSGGRESDGLELVSKVSSSEGSTGRFEAIEGTANDVNFAFVWAKFRSCTEIDLFKVGSSKKGILNISGFDCEGVKCSD